MLTTPDSSHFSEDDDEFDSGLTDEPGRALTNKLGLLLIVFGICILLALPMTIVQGIMSQRQLDNEWRQAVSKQEAASERRAMEFHPGDLGVSGPEFDGSESQSFPPTKLTIAKIGLDAVVVEGIDSRSLSRGPGHFPGTGEPGKSGNCCIAGHRNLYGAWFRSLDRLSIGDSVTLRTPEAEYVYRVKKSFSVSPSSVEVLQPTSDAELTLTTCTPTPLPTHRLVVVAKLVTCRTSIPSINRHQKLNKEEK